mgnify:CR=1 FL=1
MEKIVLNRIKNYTKQIDVLFKKIKQFDRIAVFRHDHPDYDALGSQMGFVSFLKDNFKDKEVIYVGDDHVTLTGRCFPKMMNVKDEWFEKPFLALVVDTADKKRVSDDRFIKATRIVKIDHHPDVEPYGDIQIVDTSMCAAGELLANILYSFGNNYVISKNCAEYLYKAIVGDSGRFLYESTTIHTFRISEILLSKGINISDIYNEMYNQDITDLKVTAYILDNYQITPHGVAYYILPDDVLKRFNLPPVRGKDNVNLFSHFDGINAWLSVTEDKEKGEWRVSIRSAKKSIQKVAEKYNGGGHDQASGSKLKSLDELPMLLNDLDNLFK